MPRPPRIHVPGGFYHVTLRGNHRQDIFRAPADRRHWEDVLGESLERVGALLHAYCWMTNHAHLVVQVGDMPLGALVRRLASRYARWFQHDVPTTGHLFERRYGAQLIGTDSYLLAVARYVHYNPVRAQLAAAPDEYPWSSHRAYLGRGEAPWLTTSRLLELLHDQPILARRAYAAFMAEQPVMLPPAVVADMTPPATGTMAPSVAGADVRVSLEQLATEVATRHGISVGALRAGGRGHGHARLRALLAWEATRRGIATLTATAAFLGCSISALSQTLDRLRRRSPELLDPATAGDDRRAWRGPSVEK